jgi:hypothetical protein
MQLDAALNWFYQEMCIEFLNNIQLPESYYRINSFPVCFLCLLKRNSEILSILNNYFVLYLLIASVYSTLLFSTLAPRINIYIKAQTGLRPRSGVDQ